MKVVIPITDDDIDEVIMVGAAAGGGVQVVTATSGKQFERDEMQVSGMT